MKTSFPDIPLAPVNRQAADVSSAGSVAETLPCPFCGGTDIRFTNHGKVSQAIGHQNDDVWSTCCYTCGATFPNRYRRELLVEQWNRRPLNDLALAQRGLGRSVAEGKEGSSHE